MTGDRSERRRQWRADCKELGVDVPYKQWTPTMFDEVKQRIAEHKAMMQGMTGEAK